MVDRTPDGTPTVKLGEATTPGAAERDFGAEPSAFDPLTDRFTTSGELGRGGMGRVDDAYDRALDRPVAIKHMLSTAIVDLKRFEREARITAQLEHPGIVPIHDAGRNADGTPYYVMRRVDGQPLDQRVTESLVERLALIPNMLAACDALAFAHARGVIHRDIKPTNILIGPFGETLVIDWGLARKISETEDGTSTIPISDLKLTRVGTVAGTPGFMSPEQARGEAVDARADVFALGATIYFVLAGTTPYGPVSATEMIGMAGSGRSADFLKISQHVPPELVAITRKAMAPEPEDRYRDAGELATDLRRFITGNLVGAYEYGYSQRLWRFVRRHRAAFVVALVGLAIVIAGAVLSVRRVLAERDTATRERAIAETRRREAQSNADLLRVQHALELANSDPVAAIVALRGLAPDSDRWAEARVAAQSAMTKGIPTGFAGMRDGFSIQIQGDNRHVLITNVRATEVQIVDLIARTSSTESIVAQPGSVVWMGPDHLAMLHDEDVGIFDLHTHAVRTLPLAVARIMSDHGDKIWLKTNDGRLVEIIGPDGAPRELARDLVDVWPSSDLSEAVFVTAKAARVWTPHSSMPLMPVSNSRTIFVIEGGRIASVLDAKLHRWHVDGDHVVDDNLGNEERFVINVVIANDRYYLMGRDGFGMIFHGVYYTLDQAQGMMFATSTGMVELQQEGVLRVYDKHDRYLLGRRASGLNRADVSSDSRFVVALTTTGDVLEWELGAIRPHTLAVSTGSELIRLTDHDAWTSTVDLGVIRTDLLTNTSETIYPAIGVTDAFVDRDGHWLLARVFAKLHILDLDQHRELGPEPLAVTGHDHGLIEVTQDGSVATWNPGEPGFRVRARLPTTDLESIAASGRYAYVLYAHHLDRLDLETGKTEPSPITKATAFGVQSDGTCWAVTPEHVARWATSDPQPVVFPLPMHPSSTIFEGNGVLFDSGDSITVVRGNKLTTIAHGSKNLAWDGGSTVATIDAAQTPSVVDLATGLGYTLPTVAQHLVVHGDAVLLGSTTEVSVWKVDVPRDPVALRAWLATVTNARTVEGSEAYTWP